MQTQTQQQPEMKALSAKKHPVFIVDDDESYLSALGFRLMKDDTQHTYKIYCYNSGEECVHHLGLEPKVIILDYYLNSNDPEAMSGLDVIRRVKLLHPEIPIVILSGQHSMSIALETLHEGVYTYLMKDRTALAKVEQIIKALINEGPLS